MIIPFAVFVSGIFFFNFVSELKYISMKIHQYTSIDSLALILKNKTIRFKRLDKMDDIEEAALSNAGIHLGVLCLFLVGLIMRMKAFHYGECTHQQLKVSEFH